MTRVFIFHVALNRLTTYILEHAAFIDPTEIWVSIQSFFFTWGVRLPASYGSHWSAAAKSGKKNSDQTVEKRECKL